LKEIDTRQDVVLQCSDCDVDFQEMLYDCMTSCKIHLHIYWMTWPM